MKHLAYKHSSNRALVETLTGWIRGMLPASLRSPNVRGAGPHPGRRVLVVAGWILTLVIQAVLLILVAELIELAHGLASLYLDLARQQLDLTSLYVAATSV
jgi:hypothetical protein